MAKDEQTEQKDWQLEEGGNVDDRWVLQDSEQQVNDQWDIEGTDEPISQWQPVEYEKKPRSRLTWILPTLVTLALLGVLVFSVWTLGGPVFNGARAWLGQITNNEPPVIDTPVAPVAGEAKTAAAATADAETAAPPTAAADTPVPTAEPPTPVPAPTLPIVEQRFATVISAYGVNARRDSSMDAEIIRILEQNETFFVYGTEEEADGIVWLKLLVADGPLTEGQPVTGTVGYAAAEYFAQGDQPIAQALYEAALRAGGITPTPQAAEAAPVETTTVEAAPTGGATLAAGGEQTSTVPLPTVTPVSAVAPNPAAAITVTVNAPAGANVRRLPDLTSDIVALLPDQTVAPAISRTPLSDWLLLDLGDGAQGWISLELTLSGGDVIGLPVTNAGELPQPTPTPAETPTPEAAANAQPVEPPTPYTSQLPAGVAGALVVSTEGVNARPSPDTESAVLAILPQGAALPVVGRSADGEWLLIELPQGGTAWIFRSTIIPSGDVTGVPVSAAAGTAATQPAGEATPAAAGEVTVAATVEATVEAGAAAPAPTTAASKPVAAEATVRSIVVPIYTTPSSTSESIERVGKGAVLPATGRSADGQWVRVQSAAGATGWIAASAVDLSVDVETLAVIE